MFVSSGDNRPLNLKKRKRLRESMQEYGFLKPFPLSCSRNGDRKLIVKDGQHRLTVAEELGLNVHYFVEDVDYDIAKVNCTQEKWVVRDFAMKHANTGKKAYQDGLDEAANRKRTAIARWDGVARSQHVGCNDVSGCPCQPAPDRSESSDTQASA